MPVSYTGGSPAGFSAQIVYLPILAGFSTVSQTPAGLDIPLQINFGAAQGSGATEVQLTANGDLIFNQGGTYQIRLILHFGRTGGAGTSTLLFRALVNGVSTGITVAGRLDSANTIIPYDVDSAFTMPPASTLKFEVLRDGSGTDDGELIAVTPNGSWDVAPSATILIYRIAIA